MLRSCPQLCRLLCSPTVSGTLVRSTSSSCCQNQQRHLHLHDAARTLPKDHLTHYRGVGLMNSTAASQRRSRTDGFKKIMQFLKSDLFLSSGQLPWCTSTLYSTVNSSHHSSLCAVQYRRLSLSATAYNGDATETSSKARWAADAATTTTSNATTTTAAADATAATTEFANTVAGDISSSVDAAAQVLSELPAQGDFASLGLGGYSPIGLIQSSLEYLHVQANLPWWLAIISCTIALRVLMFPLSVKVQANGARMNNIQPEMEKLMEKMKRYNQTGNKTMAAQTTGELLSLYQKNGCNPYTMFLTPFIQVPVFISFFVAIRRMAAVPVESMKTGGLYWFTDLTVPDPYYILPFMACAAFIVTLELGGEAGVTNPKMEKMKTGIRAMAILLIPVTAKFPAGLFMYWLTSSLFTMGQISLLKFPSFRSRMSIPELVKHPQQDKAKKDGQGFLAMVKSNYNSSVLTSEAKDREAKAKKRYEKMKKDPAPKLYDKPSDLR